MEKIRSIEELLVMHKAWLLDYSKGSRLVWCQLSSEEQVNFVAANLRDADLEGCDLSYANLRYANLSYANLRNANLEDANLRDVDLRNANLSYANLRDVNLRDANLRYATLRDANLSYANLRYANLEDANLRYANLKDANLRNANLSYANLEYVNLKDADLRNCSLDGVSAIMTSYYHIQCPEEGSFIAFKKLEYNKIAKLEIPADARRSSATTRKCRASHAKVLEIFSADNIEEKFEVAHSTYDRDFEYKVGEFVFPDSFDEGRFNECGSGIHFFITKQEAIDY